MAECESSDSAYKRMKGIFDEVKIFGTKKNIEDDRLNRFKATLEKDPALATCRAVRVAPKVQDGFTPLHAAGEVGNVAVIQVLLDCASVSPWCRDLQGRTPLHIAAAAGHRGASQVLQLAMQNTSATSEKPVGEFAPVDLANLTPAALSARKRLTADRAMLEQELYVHANPLQLPAVPVPQVPTMTKPLRMSDLPWGIRQYFP